MPYLRFCFTRGFVLFSLALFAIYALVLAVRWPEFSGALGDLYHLRLTPGDLALLYLTALVVIAIHELGHAYTCKHFGGQVHEMGAMLIYFEPAFFCNCNDAWTFPELRARLWVTAAGSWIQMVIASLAAVVWWAAAPGTLVSEVALACVLIGGFTTVLMNVNPLIPLDGYYALSDWLEVPNLRQRAFAHLAWLIKSKLFRLDVPAPSADARERRIFTVYSLLAAGYISSILLLVGGVVYGWLSEALGVLGALLFAAAVWRMAREPLQEWGRTAVTAARGMLTRLPRGRRARMLAAGGGVVLIVALVPRPITVGGPFTVAPGFRVALVAADSGVVFDITAREGAVAPQGATLARIRNLDLERAVAAGARAVDSLALREGWARARGRDGEVARLADAGRAEAARLGGLRRRVESLVLRAPERALIVTPRPEEQAGRSVALGDTVLELADPELVEARIAVQGAGASMIRPGLPVRLVSHADPGLRLSAVVAQVSAAASDSGGAVETRVPLEAAVALRPGMTGEASVTLRRSNAWGALWWALRRRLRTDLLL
ncbi:MAG: HlyD family efflux transporter periplasmic adaptor subunit [Gemmatimonadales bacterium]|nr:HlyD family efflux transporter periplasmic adaptor subunit [Gemmatimonadales bacterium]